MHMHIYRVFKKWNLSRIGSIKEVKVTKKVLYHFAIFAIVNELLIIKICCISLAYCLMQARDEMRLPTIEIAEMHRELFIKRQ